MSAPSEAGFTLELKLTVADCREPGRASTRTPIKRFGLQVSAAEPPRAGVPVDLNLLVLNHFTKLTLPDGSFRAGDGPVPSFDLSHEKLLHLFVVRDDLGAFAHEHPEPAARARFGSATRFRRLADIACSRTSRRATPARRS